MEAQITQIAIITNVDNKLYCYKNAVRIPRGNNRDINPNIL